MKNIIAGAVRAVRLRRRRGGQHRRICRWYERREGVGERHHGQRRGRRGGRGRVRALRRPGAPGWRHATARARAAPLRGLAVGREFQFHEACLIRGGLGQYTYRL